jgi:hypothetical protein
MTTSTKLFVAVLGMIGAASVAAWADAKTEEQEAGPVVDGQGFGYKCYVVSAHGAHLATVGRKGSRVAVTVDGVAGPRFEEIVATDVGYIDPRPWVHADINDVPRQSPVTFSKDGKRFAYLGRQGQEWVLMADNKELLRLPTGGATGTGGLNMRMEFAGPDGQHLFFAKSSFAGYELWVDGQKMPGFYASGGGGSAGTVDPAISPDGMHFAYVATMGTHPGDKQALILDGKEAGFMVDNLQFSADSAHLIGIGRANGQAQLLVNGKSLFSAKEILAVYTSPTGHRVIPVLRHTNKDGTFGQFLLVDGKPVEASLSQQIKKVVFSPDGRRYAALCGRTGAEFVVVDGKKGEEYQFISDMESARGTTLRFSDDGSKVGYLGNAAGKCFIVINGEESDAFDGNAFFLFSPDGKHVVMSGMRGQDGIISIDGRTEKVPLRSMMAFDTFTFSPDFLRCAYIRGGNQRDGGAVYVDRKETGLSGTFTFSPDSKHVVVVGYRIADNKRGLFLDGQLVSLTTLDPLYRAFTPDSQHLYWMTREPAKDPGAAPGSYEFVTYLDGKAVARCDQRQETAQMLLPNGFGQYIRTSPAWEVGPDGTLTCLGSSGDVVKRFRITPSSDTSIAMMVEGDRDKEKADADAGKKHADQHGQDHGVAAGR